MSDLKLLEPYITKDQPFGPIDSAKIKEYAVLDLLFEKQSRVYRSFKSRPSIIMGRRGSGKTSYLKSVYFQDQYQYFAEVMTATVVEHISRIVQEISGENVYVESISNLWEKTLWTCVLTEIHKRNFPTSKNSDVVDEYLERMGIQNDDSIDTVLWKLESLYREVMETNPKNGLSEVLRQFDLKNFEGAKSAAIESLKAVKGKFVILMDSLEEFHISIESIGRAIKGLLYFAGSMNNPYDVVDIRLCLPTELTRVVYDLSSNALKDFKHLAKLEWTATDLILIGAQRLMYFLGLYYPDLIRGKSPFDELNRSRALDLFKIVLPDTVTNQNNFQEISISYILRHTQLLPRHFLMLLNSIFRSTYNTQSLNPFPVKNEKIIYGIRQVEEPIVKEIFSAFLAIHPAAQDACRRCLPELEHTFTLGRLHHIFNQKGKAVFNWGEFDDFYRMLVEIGAIGKVSAKSDYYITGKFQYAIGHELSVSYNDDLCIHPLFSGIYDCTSGEKRPIYPEGNGLDDQDYRNMED